MLQISACGADQVSYVKHSKISERALPCHTVLSGGYDDSSAACTPAALMLPLITRTSHPT